MKLMRWVGLGTICLTSTTWAQEEVKPNPQSKSINAHVDLPAETLKQIQNAQLQVQQAQEKIQQAQHESTNAQRDLNQAVRKQVSKSGPTQRRYTVIRQLGGDSKNTNSFVKLYGFDFVGLDPVLRAQLSLPMDQGLVIVTVTPGSYADQAGVKAKDVITQVDSKPVANIQAARDLISKTDKKSIDLDLIREGKPIHLSLNRPQQENSSQKATYWIGTPVAPVDATLRSHLPDLAPDTGLIVTDVVAESPAAKGGVLKFDILVKVDDRSVNTNEALVKQIQESEGKALRMELLRASKTLVLTIIPEKRFASGNQLSTQDLTQDIFLNYYQNLFDQRTTPGEVPTITDRLLINPGNIDGTFIRAIPGRIEGLPLVGPGTYLIPNLAGSNLRLEKEMRELSEKLENLQKLISEMSRLKSGGKAQTTDK